jgi:hypothetical protein
MKMKMGEGYIIIPIFSEEKDENGDYQIIGFKKLYYE